MSLMALVISISSITYRYTIEFPFNRMEYISTILLVLILIKSVTRNSQKNNFIKIVDGNLRKKKGMAKIICFEKLLKKLPSLDGLNFTANLSHTQHRLSSVSHMFSSLSFLLLFSDSCILLSLASYLIGQTGKMLSSAIYQTDPIGIFHGAVPHYR